MDLTSHRKIGLQPENLEFEINAQSEGSEKTSNRWALLVGINSYEYEEFGDLEFCINDVEALEKVLSELKYTVCCMRDDKSRENNKLFPTKRNILKKLEYICKEAKENDLILVHFSCHGLREDGKHYLIADNTSYDELEEDALKLTDVKNLIIESKAKKKVMFLDACHLGVDVGRKAVADAAFVESVIKEARGFALIAASTAQQAAQEVKDKKHGLFTYYLLEGLRGNCKDEYGYVTVQNLYDYIHYKIRETYVKSGGILQEPTLEASGLGKISLAHYPSVIPNVVPSVFTNLPGRNGAIQFVGREQVLEELHKLLQENPLVAITGMAGIGKTELAHQYAKKCMRDFQAGICWIRTQDKEEDIGTQILNFMKVYGNIQLKEDLDIGLNVKRKVQYYWNQWSSENVLLIILDNVISYKEDVEPYLPPHGTKPQLKFLITSRYRFGTSIKQVELDKLSPESASELLKAHIIPEAERMKDISKVIQIQQKSEDISKICTWLGYLPLGLELVGRYINYNLVEQYNNCKKETLLEDVLNKLKDESLKSRALRKEFEENNSNLTADMTAELGVYAALELSWEALEDQSRHLGCLLSLFSQSLIVWSVIEQIASDQDTGELKENRKQLYELHLLKGESPDEGTTLHELVQKFFQHKAAEITDLQVVKQNKSYSDTAKILNRETLFYLLQGNLKDAMRKGLMLKPFCPVEPSTRSQIDPLNRSKALINLGLVCIRKGKLDRAFKLLNAAEEICKDERYSNQNLDHEAAKISANLARVYIKRGHLENAVQSSKDAISLFELLHQQRSKAQALLILGNAYSKQAKCEERKGSYTEALSIFQELKDFRGQGQALISLAMTDIAEGQINEAYQKYHEALVLFRRINSMRDQVECLYRWAKACISSGQGRGGEAIKLLQSALEIAKVLNDLKLQEEVSMQLHEIYKNLGDSERASVVQKTFLSLMMDDPGSQNSD